MSSPQKMTPSALYSPASTASSLSYTPGSTSIKIGGTKRPLQPATSAPASAKKRIQFNGMGYVLPAAPPASVARRNARERNRVKQVNMGFAVLRQHIPPAFCEATSGSRAAAKSRKVSKVDTLRCAVEYIRSLQDLLSDSDACSDTASSSACSSSENMSPPAHMQSKSFTYGHHHQTSPSNYSDASSPTPSDYYGSEHSYYTASSQWGAANGADNDLYDVYDAPDFAESVEAPNDEELLDAISWWQQSQ